MGHPIIDKIVREGVNAVNVSMLSHELRGKLLTEAGMTLMRQNKYREAGQAFAIAENTEMLREQGRWFLQQQKVGLAAYFLLHVEKDEEKLADLAQRCIASGDIDSARAIYEKMNDSIMLSFLKENFA